MDIKQIASQLGYLWILGGGLTRQTDGTFTTNGFNVAGDKFGTTLDRLRVVAAAVLYRLNPTLILVPSAGKGQYEDDPHYPTIASVMKQELITLGMPERNIITEEKSGNTNEQLKALVQFRDNHPGDYAILSNRYHTERVAAFLAFNPLLTKIAALQVLSAEEILIAHNPERWQAPIELVYHSEGMSKRIELECQGTDDIKEGRYTF